MTPEMQLQSLAYRRAGTAVALVLFGLDPKSVSLLSRHKPPKHLDRKTSEHYAVAELAGWSAGRRLFPRESPWSEEGAREAERLLRPFTRSHPELQAYVHRFRLNARKLVEDPVTWCKVTIVSGELLMRVRLDGGDLVEICRAVEETLR